MAIIRVKRSGIVGAPPSGLAQGELAYSWLAGTYGLGGDRLYIGTGAETSGVATNVEVIGGTYFTRMLNHSPGTLTANAAVIVDSAGKVDAFTATTLTTLSISANGSLGTTGQVLTSNGSTTYWSTVASGSGSTNLGQSANNVAIDLTSSSGTGTTLVAANATTAGLLSAVDQTIAGAKTFSSTIVGSINGNAATATVLQTSRTINGTAFNGSADITITAVNPNALTIGTGLSGTSYNGSAAVTIAIDSTVATLTDIQTLTNKTLTSPTINSGALSGTFSGSPTFSGSLTISTDLTVVGNLTINGTTTTINSTTLSVDDKNIELGSIASPSNTTADGGGITLKGTGDKTLNWVNATGAWTSSEDFDLLTGKVYRINGTSVLNATTLGSGVTGSSLTSVGTITTGTWSASFGAVSGANLTSLTAGNLTGTISSTVLGNSTAYVGTTGIALNRASANQGLTGILSLAMPGSTSGTITLTPAATAGTTAITIPATTGTLVTTGDTGTVTGAMIGTVDGGTY